MRHRLSSEKDLAIELASRGVSSFTEVVGGPPSWFHACFHYFVFAALSLILNLAMFFDFYAVQLSRFTGNYAETEATVVSVLSEVVTSKKYDWNQRRYVKRKTIRCYTKAVSDDGIEFNFNGIDYGRSKGSKIRINYWKNHPVFAYTDVSFHYKILYGLVMLVLYGIFFWSLHGLFRWRQMRRELYLPVRKTSRYEVRTVFHNHSSHEVYASVYQYTFPNGASIHFRGMWTLSKPEGESENDYKEFRVYMINPDNHKNNTYYIKSIRRQV
ncbi:hypothetical protein [Succinimonas sp.]|uniref:hypothetical protein n=1 Tax=Succinimonas sp. TaxID=1936151 RepID=UPI003869E8D3